MKFIRDIIGEKQIQSFEPDEARHDPDSTTASEPDVDEWSIPPVDLTEGLDDDQPNTLDPELDEDPADTPSEPTTHVSTRPRPRVTPEASVIRRALWPDELEPPQVPPVQDATEQEDLKEKNSFQDQLEQAQVTTGTLTPKAPDQPRFGRQAYLDALPENPVDADVPTPPVPARGGRVKTRLLGFGGDLDFPADPIQQPTRTSGDTSPGFPVGWLVIVSGPGRGTCFTLQSGVAQIGRGEGQGIRLDFGDTSISRENHAAIAFDTERNAFFIGHGGKANLVRCNDMPVLSTQELSAGDQLRIGETTLLFTPLCGPGFSWASET